MKNYCIIIMSCDSYSDIWEPLVESIERFWSDCPFDIYICSEKKEFSHSWIKNIKVGERASWGKMLHHVLDTVNTPNVIYFQEDYLLKGKTNNTELLNLIDIYEKTNAAYLRLLPWPGPDIKHSLYKEVGICFPNSQYRTSLQAAIWDVQVLKSITNLDDDGRFESWSIERSNAIDREFLCVMPKSDHPNINQHPSYAIDYFATGVFQGKWLKECLHTFEPLGIKIDTNKRGVMNRLDFYKFALRRKENRSVIEDLIYNTLNRIL